MERRRITREISGQNNGWTGARKRMTAEEREGACVIMRQSERGVDGRTDGKIVYS